MLKIFYLLLVILALAVTGCNVKPAASEATSDIQNTPLPEATSVTTNTLPPAPTGKLVTDDRIGFTFTYPDDWVIVGFDSAPSDGVAYAYSVQSFEPTVGGGGLPEGQSKIDVYVNADETFQSLDAVLQKIEAEASTQENTRIASSERFTLDGGIEAMLIQGENTFGEFESVHLLINGYHIIVGGIGEQRFMYQVANSIRPT